MKNTLLACGLAIGLVAGASRADGPRFEHAPLPCVPRGGNALVAVKLVDPVPVQSVRAYFHAGQYDREGDHYVELRHRGNGEYWGLFPIAKGETERVRYRVTLEEVTGAELSTDPIVVEVRNACSVPLTDGEKRSARALLIGQTSRDQATVPLGFKGTGIIGEIDVAGELRTKY